MCLCVWARCARTERERHSQAASAQTKKNATRAPTRCRSHPPHTHTHTIHRWLLGVARAHAASTPRSPYRARAWHPLPGRASGLPLEPILKLLACFIGVNGELWYGHESWR